MALLRTKLSVYESEGIQCQLTFQYRAITLNVRFCSSDSTIDTRVLFLSFQSTQCSSCALEQDNNGVRLYIEKDVPTLDYVDVATELTRFVHQRPLNALVYAISEKLASPLDTLKRRGIPVDRLLKTIVQQRKNLLSIDNGGLVEIVFLAIKLVSRMEYQISSSPSPSAPTRYTSTTTNNSIERISHFGHQHSSQEAVIDRMIRTSRPYLQTEFRQPEHSREETNNLCEFIPSSNMVRHQTCFHEIPLFVDENVILTDSMTKQAHRLAWLLSGLAKQVFHLSESVMHLFRDAESGRHYRQTTRPSVVPFALISFSARIAFNSNGALFFNLRYFEQVFADDLQSHLPNASSNLGIVRTIVNFYYTITCHELAHNLATNHDLNFMHHFEKVIVRFMDAKEVFLNRFSFQ